MTPLKKKLNYLFKDLPLSEGLLVFLHDFSARGPHKSRDRWRSVRYRVSRAPREGGSVYTIVLVEDPTKVKQVDRNMLKAAVGVDSPGCASSHNSSVDEPPSVDEHSFEYDLLVLRQPPPVHPFAMPSSRSTMVTRNTSQVPVPSDPGSSAGSSSMTHPVSCPGPSHEAPHKTIQSTAGHHSNVYRLTQPVGEVAPADPSAFVSNAISAIFRPWS